MNTQPTIVIQESDPHFAIFTKLFKIDFLAIQIEEINEYLIQTATNRLALSRREVNDLSIAKQNHHQSIKGLTRELLPQFN